MKFLLFLLLLPLSLLALETHTGPFSAKITLSSEELFIQDTLTITLDLAFPEEYEVDTNQLRMNLLRNPTPFTSPFSLKAETANTQPGHMQITYTLDPHTSGKQTLSFYDIPFKSKDLKAKLTSPIFTVLIKESPTDSHYLGETAPLLTFSTAIPVLPDDQNIKSLSNPNENLRNERILNQKSPPIFEAIALFLFIASIYFIKNYRKSSPEQEIRKRTLSAQQKALTSLENLKKNEAPEEYFVQLTDTVRHYIEEKTLIHAPTYTTEEFLHKMQNNPLFPEPIRNSLSHFLNSSDKVKFAKYNPSTKERDEALEAAKAFILL